MFIKRVGHGVVSVGVMAQAVLVWGLVVGGVCGAVQAEALVLYSGRSKSLVEPIVERFMQETGIQVRVKYGKTAQLSVALLEEGEKSPADVFWSQDAGALGAMVSGGMFLPIDEQALSLVPKAYRGGGGHWVATSGRARVLAYSSVRVSGDHLPGSVFDLTDSKYHGKVGWAPSNASFQAFVTAMRKTHGQEAARAWLLGMIENEAQVYPKNTAIIQGIAAGEVDYGLPNHYYLLRFKTADKDYPVEQSSFEAGDIGNLVNVAGVGVLKTSSHREAAQKFVAYLLSSKAQQYFTSETFEYPVVADVIASPRLQPLESLREGSPAVDLDTLEDLKGTLELLAEVGLR
jgi:iron(III) transport system substrate-binding protein